jgi:hypothetical protein
VDKLQKDISEIRRNSALDPADPWYFTYVQSESLDDIVVGKEGKNRKKQAK